MNTTETRPWSADDWKQQQQKLSTPFLIVNVLIPIIMDLVQRYYRAWHLSEDTESFIIIGASGVCFISWLLWGILMYRKALADTKAMEAHFAARDAQLLQDLSQQDLME